MADEDRSALAALYNVVSSIHDDLDGCRQSELDVESSDSEPSRAGVLIRLTVQDLSIPC